MPVCCMCGEEYPEEEMTNDGICYNCISVMLVENRM